MTTFKKLILAGLVMASGHSLAYAEATKEIYSDAGLYFKAGADNNSTVQINYFPFAGSAYTESIIFTGDPAPPEGLKVGFLSTTSNLFTGMAFALVDPTSDVVA